MKPHLVRWHTQWAEKGLVVIDNDDGSADGLEDVKAAVAQGAIPFPTLWDKDGRNVDAYGVQAMPSAFLIGLDGKVIWEGVPNDKIAEIEKLIEQELKKVASSK